MSLLGEIKRRKVFQVAAVYAVVAWLIMQIVDVVSDPLSLPAWFDTVAIVLLAIGFPIAVILAWAFDLTPQGIRGESDVQKSLVPVHAGGQRLNYLLQGLVLVAVGFLVIDQYVLEPGARLRAVGGPTSPSPASSANVRRTSIILGETEPVGNTGLRAHVAFSPDSQRLVYAAQVVGTSQLYLRELDQLEARPMPGTEGAFYPFFSPDGEWVVFHTDVPDGNLKRVSVRGGAPQTLTDATFSGGGSWVIDDTIVISTGDPSTGRRLFRIPATGGAPEVLIPPDPDTGHVLPEVLPGGDAVLFVIRTGPGGGDAARDGSISVLSLETNEIRTLVAGGHTPRYAPTGHILFVRAGDLWAVPFDIGQLETTGREVLVVDGVEQDGTFGGAAYAISNDGMLVYVPGGDMGIGGEGIRTPVWVDRGGREESLDVELRDYYMPQLSPDGARLTVVVGSDDDPGDIWIIDLARGTSSRLTFNPGADWFPRWSPDSQRVVFWSDPLDEEPGLFWQAADGTGQAERLTTAAEFHIPQFFTPDETQLVFEESTGGGGGDLYLLALGSDSDPQPLLNASYNEMDAAISPDGRWMAYGSDETGRFEIYVRPFPNVDDGRRQISGGGATEPLWGPDGRELFFRSADRVLTVSVQGEGSSLVLGTPEELFAGASQYENSPDSSPNYDVSEDGQRFIMLKLPEEPLGQTVLVAVENWFEELRRLAPSTE